LSFFLIHVARRIRRSGQYGHKALAINIVAAEEMVALKQIEQFYNSKIDELPMNIADLI
jgi:translation initiation factor 4A